MLYTQIKTGFLGVVSSLKVLPIVIILIKIYI